MEQVVRGNSFSRVNANEEKKGAYYTNIEMCERMGRLPYYPADGEVAVLEPSVGDGSAVRAFLAQNQSSCKTPLFAVELDKKAAEELRPRLSEGDVLLNTDFIRGTTVTPNSFGLCFANPPYGVDGFAKQRYEEIFLRLIYTHLKKDGVCFYVVPYYLFTREEGFVAALMARFEIVSLYRFDDEVYKQFQQVCVVLRRRPRMDYSFGKTAYAEFVSKFPPVEALPYLPEEPTEEQRVSVPVAESKDVKVFATVLFDADTARESLHGSALDKVVGEKLFIPSYRANELPSPPIPTSSGTNNMLIVGGAGLGLCGDEADGDLHLPRGVVKTVTDRYIREGEGKGEDGSAVIVEKTRAAVSLTIVQASGEISRFS